MSKYRCTVCGYIHEGDSAPEKCPVCGAPASAFELVEGGGEAKNKFLGGRNSNAYIIFYATVMVVLVAAILAITSLSLKDLQNANVMNEKKTAIMQSLSSTEAYDEAIDAYAVDAQGDRIESITADQALNMLFDLPTAIKDGTYPVFVDKQSGRVVIPVTGKGLWDDIWGYVALENDMNTISGVVFAHAGETPGLGAEIATPKFWAQFPGKTIYEGANLVAIDVVKGGAQGAPHGVDAISGGTKTSIGLQNMLKDCLGNYAAFFESQKSAAQMPVEVTETVKSNPENTESNE